jgi:hypothetical protein
VGLEPELGFYRVMIGSAGSKPVAGFVVHDKKIAAVKMTMHFPYPVFVDDI